MERIAVDPTLEEVRDADGDLHAAREVLTQHYDRLVAFRLDVEESVAAGNPLWRCSFCGDAAVVRCQMRRKGDVRESGAFHFQHKHHNPNCPGSKAARLSQAQILAAKYHGQREGAAHRRLKQWLYESLTADARFSDVSVEKTWRGVCRPDKWRRPDVAAHFGGQPVVFEIQLSTTFISVMAERRLFYRTEGVCLVWIVADFDPAWTTLAHESAFYPNNANLFIVNEHTRSVSVARQATHLEAVWLEPRLAHGHFDLVTQRAEVDFGALTIDGPGMRVFYFDVDGLRGALEAQLAQARQVALQAQEAAHNQALEQRRMKFRQDFERCWYDGLKPSRSIAELQQSQREWLALRHPARLLGIELPEQRQSLTTALNVIYSARDAHRGELVGFRLADLVKLAHYVHTNHKELLWPFRQALAVYDRARMIAALDHTGHWRDKVSEYKQAILADAPAYRMPAGLVPLLFLLFPELASALLDSPASVLAREGEPRRSVAQRGLGPT